MNWSPGFRKACAEYGIDPSDPVYNTDDHYDRGGESRCRVCIGHVKDHRRARCDLELARASEMDDPRICVHCRRAYDYRSCEPDCDTGWFGTCGECQARHAEEEQRRQERIARLPRCRLSLSPARAAYVRHQFPERNLNEFSPAELYANAYDEVPG